MDGSIPNTTQTLQSNSMEIFRFGEHIAELLKGILSSDKIFVSLKWYHNPGFRLLRFLAVNISILEEEAAAADMITYPHNSV
jgi:hypothetical protein